MLEKAELNRTGGPEPAGLTRALITVAGERSGLRRRLLIGAALVCAIGLAGWIIVLAVTLPWRYRAGGWSAAWVGFDAVLFLAFAATAWAAWRRRQVLILCLVIVAVLLFCDAWFDSTLDWGTPGFMESLTLALVVEVPLAILALIGARRLLRLTFRRLDTLKGDSGPVAPFWKVPLFGEYSAGDGYRDLFRPPEACPVEAAPGTATPGTAKPERATPEGVVPGPGDRAA